MKFGIALPTAADSWKVVERAEDLGFVEAWFYDTQMLSAGLDPSLTNSSDWIISAVGMNPSQVENRM